MSATAPLRANATVVDLAPALASVRQAVLDGLAADPKRLPPWLFYDAEGSRLFERICEQPEYYPTRTELAILRDNAAAIAAALGPGCRLVELGAGSHRKARALLRTLNHPDGYVAIDISGEQLRASVAALAREFPALPVTGIVADYAAEGDLPIEGQRLVGFFPGSTVGNMDPDEAEAFLRGWADRLAGGGMLVGVDLVKDSSVLEAAYNDAAGVTAAFNRNMLAHVNAALGCDFDPARFRHRAFFDPGLGRVEMHLVSTIGQAVQVCGRRFALAAGESIHTENSWKYTLEGFQQLATRAGFKARAAWTDDQGWFSVHWLEAAAGH